MAPKSDKPAPRPGKPKKAPTVGLIAIDPWLDHLVAHLPIAREGKDIEGVHQLRVATRRLDVFLRLSRRRMLRDDLRWLRGAAGSVRDLDVLLSEMEHPEAFAAWLRERHGEARADLVTHLADRRLAGLTAALAVLPPIGRKAAWAGMRKLAKGTWKVGVALEEEPHDVDRLHRLRRSLRRLRYGLEWLGEPTKVYKHLQDSLGHVGDLAVTLRLVEECPEAGLDAYRDSLQRKLRESHDAALADWRAARPNVKALRTAKGRQRSGERDAEVK